MELDSFRLFQRIKLFGYEKTRVFFSLLLSPFLFLYSFSSSFIPYPFLLFLYPFPLPPHHQLDPTPSVLPPPLPLASPLWYECVCSTGGEAAQRGPAEGPTWPRDAVALVCGARAWHANSQDLLESLSSWPSFMRRAGAIPGRLGGIRQALARMPAMPGSRACLLRHTVALREWRR